MRAETVVPRTGRRVALVVIGLAILIAGGWQIRHLQAQSVQALSPSTGSGLTLYNGARGVEAPAIDGRTIDGQDLALADLRGHVVVLNVWGSWCAPCRVEAPDLAKVARETKAQGVRFVGIDTRDNLAAARAFVRNYGLTYPSWEDQSGVLLAQFSGIVPVSAVPSTLVLDANGVIRARVIGRVNASTLRGLIQDAG